MAKKKTVVIAGVECEDIHPTLSCIPLGHRVRILRDGVEVTVVRDANAAFMWLTNNHLGRSASWQLMHNGFTCEIAND